MTEKSWKEEMVKGGGFSGDRIHSCHKWCLLLRRILQGGEMTTTVFTIAQKMVDIMCGRERGEMVTTEKKQGVPGVGPD